MQGPSRCNAVRSSEEGNEGVNLVKGGVGETGRALIRHHFGKRGEGRQDVSSITSHKGPVPSVLGNCGGAS